MICTGSSPTRDMSEIGDGEDLWQWFRLEIRLSTFRRSTIPQNQFFIIIIIIIIIKNIEAETVVSQFFLLFFILYLFIVSQCRDSIVEEVSLPGNKRRYQESLEYSSPMKRFRVNRKGKVKGINLNWTCRMKWQNIAIAISKFVYQIRVCTRRFCLRILPLQTSTNPR